MIIYLYLSAILFTYFFIVWSKKTWMDVAYKCVLCGAAIFGWYIIFHLK